MQADTTFWDSLVFDGIDGIDGIDDVDVESVTAVFGTVDVTARGRASGAACPDCGWFSNRVHGSYQRRLKDLPLAGQRVVLRLTVRRFICGAGTCPRRTFAEPFAQLTVPYARFTTRLGHVLERVGLALAGRAGARLSAQLGFRVARMTLLRRGSFGAGGAGGCWSGSASSVLRVIRTSSAARPSSSSWAVSCVICSRVVSTCAVISCSRSSSRTSTAPRVSSPPGTDSGHRPLRWLAQLP
ncbi:transposase family protein [Streptomyces iconiensis]|uniref:Transposase family protein n=1 Tax=Streptomyces iconiensis TaxID=1384038 RepID=A0ABT6ZX65_9ACTN|nr:transposase family protein [Streptomyces iconiensis]MDJ1133656.1 transposase family protein [Streptomyces iconiensis]